MAKFKHLTSDQYNKIDKLLNIADDVLSKETRVVKENSKAAKIIEVSLDEKTEEFVEAKSKAGKAAGVAGAGVGASAIAGKAVGIAGKSAIVGKVAISTLSGLLIFGGLLLSGGVGYLISKNISKKERQEAEEEIQKQTNYAKEISKKQQEIYEKYEKLKKEHKRTDKEKDELIKQQMEKIAEYEAMLNSLFSQFTKLTENLTAV